MTPTVLLARCCRCSKTIDMSDALARVSDEQKTVIIMCRECGKGGKNGKYGAQCSVAAMDVTLQPVIWQAEGVIE